jgi:hypothetical protein
MPREIATPYSDSRSTYGFRLAVIVIAMFIFFEYAERTFLVNVCRAYARRNDQSSVAQEFAVASIAHLIAMGSAIK